MEDANSIRLNKYISESGICSRRQADKYIEGGHVFVNGKRAKLGDQVKPGDKIRVNGQHLDSPEEKQTLIIALNKPVGVTSTTESNVKDNIVSFVNYSERVFPIGRLDKDSQGLILLTNNGDIVNKILRAGNQHEKEYVVTVDKPITEEFIKGMAGGVPILGERTRKCKVTKEAPFVFRIILTQGLNRQIRRMCEYFGYEVVKLERVRIMHITLKKIPLGDWRELTPDEVAGIMKAIEHSASEPEPPKRKFRSKPKPKGESTSKKVFSAPGKGRNDRPAPKGAKKPGGKTSFKGRRS